MPLVGPLVGRLPLSIRIPLLVVGLMIAVAIIASQQVLSSLDRLQSDRIRELAGLHVEALAVALGPHVLRNDIWEVYDVLERATGEDGRGRTVFSAVGDTEGRVLAATDPQRAPVDSDLALLAQDAQGPEDLSVSRRNDRLKLFAPLYYQGRHVGDIVTELDISDVLAERARAQRLLLMGNAAAALVLAGIGYLAVRRTLRPVTTLVARMQSAEGAPEPIAPEEIPAGDTEVARLMHTYNALADAVVAKAETERRLAERERLVSLGRLSSSLAHEINNPLGGLLNATDTIRRFADRPDAVRESAELLDRGLRHLRDVAKATLDLNRLERSGRPLSAEDFEDLHLLIGPEVAYRHQELDWSVENGAIAQSQLPAAPVRQIALNLLLNASKAAGEGGRVAFSVDSGAVPGIEIRVIDNGPGLDESARARLLGDGPLPPGSGVGLRMVRDLVTNLGGRIEMDNKAGGARITVILNGGAGDSEERSEAC